jgi:endonuclease YncB( thermonuclease family)
MEQLNQVASVVSWLKNRLMSCNGEDVALAQLDAGVAWVYRQYVGELQPGLRTEYMSAEDRAAAARVGLWRDNNPVPPWEWRSKNTRSSSVERK